MILDFEHIVSLFHFVFLKNGPDVTFSNHLLIGESKGHGARFGCYW